MPSTSDGRAWYCSPMLTPDDLLTIAPAAAKLAEGIAEALRKDSDGGAKITREEGRRILADARALVVVLAHDIID